MDFNAALVELERLAGVARPRPKSMPTSWMVVDSFYIDEEGVVLGTHLDLDNNTSGSYNPLYYYNRSWRFIGLFNAYHIPIHKQGLVLQRFEELERAWEDTKDRYTRVYFLTQKLLLQEITRRLGISSTQPSRRPISDRKRYRAQMDIFDDLWKKVLLDKCHDCTSGTSSSSGNTPPIQNSLSRTVFSR